MDEPQDLAASSSWEALPAPAVPRGPAPVGDGTSTSRDAEPTRPAAAGAVGPSGADGDTATAAGGTSASPKKRRRGSRGGKGRSRAGAGRPGAAQPGADVDATLGSDGAAVGGTASASAAARDDVELPEPIREGRPSPAAAAEALVPLKPRIGDTRPAPAPRRTPPAAEGTQPTSATGATPASKKRRRGRGGARTGERTPTPRSTRVQLDQETLERRRGRERKGRPVGRYMMCVHVSHGLTQVAVLEGRSLIEHYVSRPADDVNLIHGNIYLGRVQNVLPGMEAAFVDIATPKNAVLYAGDVQYDLEDIVEKKDDKRRIEHVLKNRQLILCQVTKNPIGAKGARLTQEVSLPGRFVVLIPNSKTYGISKRLPDDERRRLRAVLDRVKEPEHGLIVRTAAENATEEELRADVIRLNETWREIEARAEQARKANRAQLLYREPDLAVRVIREEFNLDYRSIVIDDRALYEEVRRYVEVMNPELAERVRFYDPAAEGLPLFEQFHVHEQLHKALDRKVWLQSGGSLVIDHTEALTVIDVNTGKNVGSSSLEATVLHNNLEAAQEIARQLRLRDIGGIIVIDFIDMEVKENRRKVVDAFRDALARDKTRSQVFDISELGLVEMTRKRIGEGLLQGFASQCPECGGRGLTVNYGLLD